MRLRNVAAFMEREAGYILLSYVLIWTGVALWKFGMPKGEDLVPFALGIIARSMGSIVEKKPTDTKEEK